MKVTTDLSVTSLRPRQSGIWTPSLLFDGGEQGAWFDPSDLSTLFQDAAGTIPVTADGDQVGLILDKSGNGNHAIQSIPATRPSWRTNGNVAWFEFGGVDDRVSINPIGYASGSFGLCIGLSYLAYTPSTKYCSWRSLHIDGPYIGASHPTSVGGTSIVLPRWRSLMESRHLARVICSMRNCLKSGLRLLRGFLPLSLPIILGSSAVTPRLDRRPREFMVMSNMKL